MGKQDFVSHNVYTLISHYFYWLLMLNVLFFVTNIPAVFTLLFLKMHPANSIHFLISLLPMGASMSALLACIWKLIVGKDLEAVKDYCYFYRKHFLQGSLIWLLSLVVSGVLMADLVFFTHTNYFAIATPPIIILLTVVISILLSGMALIVKTTFSLREVIRLAFYFSIKKSYLAVLNVMLFGTLLFVVFTRPVFGLFVLPSIILYIVMKNNQYMMREKQVTVMKMGRRMES